MDTPQPLLKSMYIVAIRAGSRLRFLPNERLQVQMNIGDHQANLTFQTRYCEEGYESPVPRELWADARGSADSLDSAVVMFTNATIFFTNVISFCANGYAGDCRFHLAYDATPGRREREFFEQFIEDERGLPRPLRKIKPQIVHEVINALGINSEWSGSVGRLFNTSLPLSTGVKGKKSLQLPISLWGSNAWFQS